MENNNKHTPLPWTYKRTCHLSSDTWYVLIDPTGSGPIMDVGGKDVAGQIAEAKYLVTDPDEIEANAKLIVTAVNNYHSLTRELSELREERDRLRLTLSGKTFFDEKEVMQKEIDGLREENERLKEGLMKIKAELFEQGEGYIASIINELLQSKKP
jgi:hypothetical protein